MNIREAKQDEIMHLMELGYKEWPKNRTFEQYCIDNLKEDAFGTRYVLELDGMIVSSIILLRQKTINSKTVHGIGSFISHPNHRGQGYGTVLIKHCIESVYKNGNIILLYSDINPAFYEKLNFRKLPSNLQKYNNTTFMAYCNDDVWNELLQSSVDIIPDYF